MFSKRTILVFALLSALAFGASGATASASHDLFGRASAGEINGNGDNLSTFRGISADGSHVFFETNEQLVANDTDVFEDIYERAGGKTTRISTGNGAFNSFFERASENGSRVIFATLERLAPNDTDSATDLYERAGGTTTLVSEGEINGNGDFPASFMRASDDGSRIFFISTEQLVPSDTDAEADLYQRSQGVTRRVSVGESGSGNGAFPAILRGAAADGSVVFFDTRERLVAGDTDDATDAYRRSAGTTTLVTAGQINGNGEFETSFRGASESGARAFFETDEQLVAADTDGSQDLYERSGGTTTLVSTGPINGNGAFDAFFAGASPNGATVFFQTDEQLVADDTDANIDIYERAGGATTRVSTGQINGNGNFNSFLVRVTDGGSRVLFFTSEQLVAGDTDGAQDLYERSGGATTLISAGQINGNGNFNVQAFGGASEDGSRVFFETSEQLVADDFDLSRDMYERAGGRTTLVSPGGFLDATDTESAAVSEDGSRAFFTTFQPIIQGDTDTTRDIYGAYTAPGDGPAGQPHDLFGRVSAGEINGNGGFSASLVGASDDGSRAFFLTPEQLVGGDTDGSNDLYERSGGTTTRVSAGEVNGNGAFGVNFSGISSDGARVFFNTSEPLVADDTDTNLDVYQRSGDVTRRISAGAVNGNGAFGANFERASDDGTRVLFTTDEQLVGGDTDAATDIYQRSGDATKRISVGAVNGNGAFAATFQDASDDGSSVIFRTDEQLAAGDTDSRPDLYERSGTTTTQVSAGEINGNKTFNVFFGGASADGSRVFFETQEQLVAADTDTALDVYERSGGTTTRISAGSVNGNGPLGAQFAGATDDGTAVFFETHEQLVATDTDMAEDLYRRSGGATSRISTGQINGNSGFGAHFRGVSDDGSRVFFATSEKLVTADTDGVGDIYERADGTTRRISAGEVNGNGAIDSVFARASTDGSRVFFQTSEQLAAEDTDGNTDVYERAAGRTRVITPGDSFAVLSDISDDGSVVFFSAGGPVIASDVDGTGDAYAAYLAP
jgi:hypothetical protein